MSRAGQTITNSHIRIRHPWETCSFTSFIASVSTLNYQIFTYFVQRRFFLSSCYHFNLKKAFTTVTVTGRVLFVKSAVAHAHAKKTPVSQQEKVKFGNHLKHGSIPWQWIKKGSKQPHGETFEVKHAKFMMRLCMVTSFCYNSFLVC